jgi:hypothetical protein
LEVLHGRNAFHFVATNLQFENLELNLDLDSAKILDLAVLQIRDLYSGSRILILSIPDLGSRIPDPTTTTEKGGKTISCL